MRLTNCLTLIAFAICTAIPATSFAIGDEVMDRDSLVEWYTRGDRFYLYGEDETELVSFSEPRDVKVCAATRRNDIPIAVMHDGERSIVHSGNCLTVDAKKVTVSPAEELPTYVELTGTVTTR
jgi:hypothetical protein